MKVISVICLIFAFACANAVDETEWNTLYNKCEGIKEKQVKIDDVKVVYDEKLKPFGFNNFDQLINWEYKNIDSPLLLLSEGVNVSLTVDGSNLNEVYTLWKLKLVSKNEEGSKHYINNVSYPFELHLISVNKQLKSFSVVVFLFRQVQEENVALRELLDVVTKNKTAFQWKLSSILPPAAELKDYYRYDGKSSNSSCVDEIKWSIFEKPIAISAEQLSVLGQQVTPNANRVPEIVGLREVFSSKLRTVKESVTETKGTVLDKTEKNVSGGKPAKVPENSASGLMHIAFASLITALGLNLLFV